MPTRDMTVINRPKLGEHGSPCSHCGAPLAADQRYCLACGARRSEPRVEFRDLLTRTPAAPAAPPKPGAAPPPPPARDWTPMLALAALGGLALVLIIGVLIGKSSFGDGGRGGTPQVIRVGGGDAGTGSGTGVAAAAFTSDWPDGKDGWTVELGVMPKSGATPAAVQKAKTDAQGKGAADVGALDSDKFPSLPTGNYVVYSGVFTDKKQATAALKALKAKFPDAQVVEVSQTAPSASSGASGSGGAGSKAALQDLGNASGANYEKKSRKLPTTVGIPGKPPPTDNKAPGGGSGGGETIK
jgi:hypothetical protein